MGTVDIGSGPFPYLGLCRYVHKEIWDTCGKLTKGHRAKMAERSGLALKRVIL